jgi:hypothetical protein
MANVDLVLNQVGSLHSKIRSSKKISDKEWQPLYKRVCAAFREAAPDQRVDIQIAFENRDPLLSLFVRYLDQMTQAAHKAALKDNRKAASTVLDEALTADAIIDGRTRVDDLQRIHKRLEAAVWEAGYDMEGFLRRLETPVQVYVDRAHRLHQAGNRSQAIRTLGRALQLDESLYKNEHIANFAATLTGQSPKSAILTLEDPYLRNLLIETYENPQQFQRETVEARQVVNKPQPSGKKGISAGVILAVLVGLVIVGAASYWLVFLR